MGVVYGQSGSGKSFYLLDQLLTVAQEHPVVYAPTEGLYGLNKRLTALCDYRGLDLGQLYIYKNPVELMKPTSVSTFIKHVRQLGPVLVTFDTLSGCMVGGDENAPKDMGFLIHGCQTVSRALDCFVNVAHHTSRKGKDERGHSSLRGAAEMMVAMECKSYVVTVTCTKNKDGPKFPTERYTLTPHLDSMVLKPFGALNNDQVSILRTVAAQPGIKPSALIVKTNVSQATVYRILSEFKTKDLLAAEKGGCYFITAKGKTKLSTPLSEPFDSENGFDLDLQAD